MSGSVWEFRMVPNAALPPTIPPTSHVTVASAAPVTTAWNACAAPRAKVTDTGETLTLMVEITVTVSDVAFEASASGVAVIWTVGGDGANEGALNAPLEEIVPQAAPEQPAPDTVHEMPVLGLEFAAGVRVAV